MFPPIFSGVFPPHFIFCPPTKSPRPTFTLLPLLIITAFNFAGFRLFPRFSLETQSALPDEIALSFVPVIKQAGEGQRADRVHSHRADRLRRSCSSASHSSSGFPLRRSWAVSSAAARSGARWLRRSVRSWEGLFLK